MSNYVRITSSPEELLSIAMRLSARGEALQTSTGEHERQIRAAEGKALDGPQDKFVDAFYKNYHEAPAGSADASQQANQAVTASAVALGGTLKKIGDHVNQAMVNYSATDEQGGADIGNTKV